MLPQKALTAFLFSDCNSHWWGHSHRILLTKKSGLFVPLRIKWSNMTWIGYLQKWCLRIVWSDVNSEKISFNIHNKWVFALLNLGVMKSIFLAFLFRLFCKIKCPLDFPEPPQSSPWGYLWSDITINTSVLNQYWFYEIFSVTALL